MEYTVDITIIAAHPRTEDTLVAVAAIGGVAVGNIGERHLETTLTA